MFTGPTGAGKTTLLSEMSLDLSMQGVSQMLLSNDPIGPRFKHGATI